MGGVYTSHAISKMVLYNFVGQKMPDLQHATINFALCCASELLFTLHSNRNETTLKKISCKWAIFKLTEICNTILEMA